jgi:hypothetical protein
MKIGQIDSVCKSCVVLQGKMDLEYVDGRIANTSNGAYLHHAAVMPQNRAGLSDMCSLPKKGSGSPGFPIMMPNMLIGGDGDTTEGPYYHVQSNIKSGYHILPTDKFGFMVEIKNLAPFAQSMVVVLDVDILEGDNPDWYDVHNYILNAAGCTGGIEFDLNKPQVKIENSDYAIPFDGYFMAGSKYCTLLCSKDI